MGTDGDYGRARRFGCFIERYMDFVDVLNDAEFIVKLGKAVKLYYDSEYQTEKSMENIFINKTKSARN